jgi:hypothetical protein
MSREPALLPALIKTVFVLCLITTALRCLQVGFVAIRELAVLLRNALSAKTQDAHKEVYCWQVRRNSAYTLGHTDTCTFSKPSVRLQHASGPAALCKDHIHAYIAMHTSCSHMASDHPPASLLV